MVLARAVARTPWDVCAGVSVDGGCGGWGRCAQLCRDIRRREREGGRPRTPVFALTSIHYDVTGIVRAPLPFRSARVPRPVFAAASRGRKASQTASSHWCSATSTGPGHRARSLLPGIRPLTFHARLAQRKGHIVRLCLAETALTTGGRVGWVGVCRMWTRRNSPSPPTSATGACVVDQTQHQHTRLSCTLG